MPTTTIHIPDEILTRVDARARAEGVSRNRFIVRALERSVGEDDAWPPEFLRELRRPVPAGDKKAISEMLRAILARRSRKRAPEL